MFFTLLNSAAILWIIWVLGGGGEVRDRSVEGEGAPAQAESGLKSKAGTDEEVMQVLRKLQTPQVKSLPITFMSSGEGATELGC